MNNPSKLILNRQVDTKEFELPETLFISDIDTKVFQGIVLQTLSRIEGIHLAEGNFIDSIFGRGSPEVGTGIKSEQDTKNYSVSIKIEVNIVYGLPIPEKAEEIQSKVVEEITRLTGLRVSSIHVVFRNIIPLEEVKNLKNQQYQNTNSTKPELSKTVETDTYTDEF